MKSYRKNSNRKYMTKEEYGKTKPSMIAKSWSIMLQINVKYSFLKLMILCSSDQNKMIEIRSKLT